MNYISNQAANFLCPIQNKWNVVQYFMLKTRFVILFSLKYGWSNYMHWKNVDMFVLCHHFPFLFNVLSKNEPTISPAIHFSAFSFAAIRKLPDTVR